MLSVLIFKLSVLEKGEQEGKRSSPVAHFSHQKHLKKHPFFTDTEGESLQPAWLLGFRVLNVTIFGNTVTLFGNIHELRGKHVSRITQVDSDTGEIVGEYVAVVQPKRKNAFQNGGWFALSQSEPLDILMRADLQGRDYQVFFALMQQLDYENLIQVSQAKIAEKLGMKSPHVNRSIKALIDLGIILEGPRIGRSRSFRLNPNFGWKGSAKGHHEALKARMENIGMSVVDGGRDTETLDMFDTDN